MDSEIIKQFEGKGFVFLKRKNGFFYKCKILKVSADSIMLIDRYESTHVFSLDDIIEISAWKEHWHQRTTQDQNSINSPGVGRAIPAFSPQHKVE